VAVGDRIGPEALVDAAWQARKLKAQAVLKIGDFFGLRFEVALVKVGENKVENEKSSLNKFLGGRRRLRRFSLSTAPYSRREYRL